MIFQMADYLLLYCKDKDLVETFEENAKSTPIGAPQAPPITSIKTDIVE